MGTCALFLIIGGILTIIHGAPLILFANRKDIRLVDVQNAGSNSSIVVGNLDDAAAVDFLYSEGLVFWTDINMEAIKRAYVNDSSSAHSIVSMGLVSPDGLACDWLAHKLYWTDSETNRIEVSNLDGSYRKVLYWQNLDQPRAIALDPFNGYMYWTDWGETPKIERAGMDGSPNTRNVIIDNNIYWPNGLTLDYDDAKIYWADGKLSYIHSCDYRGRQRRVVVEGELPHPFALTLFKQDLFWTDWQTKAIHTCNKETGTSDRVVYNNIYSPMDIHVYTAERQKTGNNPCAQDNGGCSHLCLMSPIKPHYKCACPTGVRLSDVDQKTCADGAEQMLFLVRRTDIRIISLDTPDYTDIVLPLQNIKHAIAIDYDPVEGFIYWTDDEYRTIRRAYIDGSAEEVLIKTEVDHPDGIAVDWIARNLYWTDTGTDRIEVARLNGTFRKVLISENLDEPRDISLDPVRGYMYWTDWGSVPKIERANLDGSDRKVLVSDNLGWPNGVAIDYEEQKIYWGDAKLDMIEVANLDGTGRRVLVNEQLPHIFGFTLLGDYIYWTDWQRRSIERVNKNNADDRTLIIDQLPDLMGLKASKINSAEGTNDCAENNGGCSHLCLYTPKGAVCACPMGLELVSTRKSCIIPEAFLLFTRQADIKRMSLATDHRIMEIPVKDVQRAMAIDFDIKENRIYWTDGSSKSISRAFMNGSAMECIVEFGIDFPEGMAVDWVAHNIYWADSGSNRIEVARLDGSSRRVLIWKNLTHPRAIALDPPNGYMYWTDWSEPPKLERARLDGTHRQVLVSNLGRVYGLTIDYMEKKLYWADMDTRQIETAALDGSNRSKILNGSVQPMAMTQYREYLYWADWSLKTIERANKTSGNNRTTVQGNLAEVMDIHVFHHSRQSGWNTCDGNNGGCSHLCLATPYKLSSNNSHHCACPTHYQLGEDNKTCVAPKSFLLFSQKNAISRLVIGSPDVVLPIKALRNIRSIDYDPVNKLIYWIGGRSRSIKRARDNGTEIITVITGNSENIQPFDLAIDPYSGLIFWSCLINNVINVTRTNLRLIGVVVNAPNQKPRYLTVNPYKGHLYWTNQANPSSIERSLFDGTEQLSLFSTRLGKPGPITIDPEAQMLFWADAEEQLIEASDLSGGNRRILVNGKLNSHIQAPRGIAVFGDFLYWVDRSEKLIGRVNKQKGGTVTFVHGRVANLSDILSVLFLDTAEVAKHPCAKNNGNCSHICMTKQNQSAQCSCPNNLVLRDDMKQCADRTTCAPDMFSCVSGDTVCIPNNWLCDGIAECVDRSDEKDCPICEASEFACGDGSCIGGHLVCDGTAQCPNKDDEKSCCESPTQMKCLNDPVCYDKKNHCDGNKDCEDGSDELNCPAETHPSKPISSHITVAIIVGVISIVIIFAIIFACRRKSPGVPGVVLDDRDMIMLTKPLNPQSEQNTPPNTLSTRSSKKTHGAVSALSRGSDSANVYDRNHVTGASSSSSAVTQYPKETLNPPPSPVTDRSVYAGEFYAYSSNSPSTVRSMKKHHRPRHIPPPPTTPCSTDVCEDSEPYFHKTFYHNSVLELNYDSDPYPPPPTPRSHCLSDEFSCPPSPSTERSFFNPYPPPPSPVATSDC